MPQCAVAQAVSLEAKGEAVHVSIEGIGTADARRAAAQPAREVAILALFRLGQIGSSQAVPVLGLTRVEFVDLATPLLDDLRRSGFWLDEATYQKARELASEL